MGVEGVASVNDVDEVRGEGVAIVDKAFFFDWPAGMVFMLRGGAWTVPSPLEMAFTHNPTAVESRTS